MSDWLIRIELLLNSAGALLFALAGLVAIGAVIYMQVREYRGEWRQARGAWWAIKLAVPLVGLLALATMLFLVRDSEGFIGLAVFYVTIFVWLVVGPFIIARIVSRTANVPIEASNRAAISLVALFVVGWFAGAGMVTSFSAAIRPLTNMEDKVRYKSFIAAAENPSPAGNAVSLIEDRRYLLNDGRRLLYLAWKVEADLKIQLIKVRVSKPGGNTSAWSSTSGHCFANGEMHFTNVLDEAESFDIKIAWHRGEPETMIGIEHHVTSSHSEKYTAHYLDVNVDAQRIDLPIPIPERFLSLRSPDAARHQYKLLGKSINCVQPPIHLPEVIDSARLTFYSEELYEHMRYDFNVR